MASPLKNTLAAFFSQALFKALSIFPLGAHHAIGSLIGRLLFMFKNRNKHIAEVNINICFPRLDDREKTQLLKKTLRENGKTLIECFWLWRHPQQVLGSLSGSIHNEHVLKQAGKQGSLFVTPHFGSWEFIGLLTASHSNLLILYAPPKSAYVDMLSCQGRSSTGGKVLSTTNLNARQLIKHVKSGGSIGILPDQVPDGNGGCYSQFYGRKAYTSTLVCKLANKLRCPVIFCYALRNSKIPLRYDAYYYEAPDEIYSDDISIGTDALNKCIESYINTRPEQYLWGYKRFKKPAAGVKNPY